MVRLQKQRKAKILKNIFEIINKNLLWNGIARGDSEKLLKCVGARTAAYEKGEIIMMSGEPVSGIGLVLSGRVKIIKEDANGDVMLLTELAAPEIFGEAFACAGVKFSPVTVCASEDCEVLFMNYKKMTASCASACGFHSRLIENMLEVVAKKNLTLNQKIEILSKRNIREKLLAFFFAHGDGRRKFKIPYNREELAHYLCVDRSALSRELCKMRDEGIISFRKNEFELPPRPGVS